MVDTTWDYSENTPEINFLAEKMSENSKIDPALYGKYDVKRGLRDIDGKGVLTGLTDISTIKQNKLVDGKLVPCEGELYYRGYNVNDIVGGILADDRFGFEEVVYLLLFGEMPNREQLLNFKTLLVQYRYSQGAQRGHDELDRAFGAHPVLLRQEPQRHLYQQRAAPVHSADFGIPDAQRVRLPLI